MREVEADANGPCVLVPGAAGAGGIDAIRCIRRSLRGSRIVATDREPLSAGFALSDVSCVTRHLDDRDAYRSIVEVMKRESVGVILPTCPADVRAYARHRSELADEGIVFVGPGPSTVELCDDKLASWHAICRDFPVPAMFEVGPEGPRRYPCFVKPRRGSGGRGCGACNDRGDWERLLLGSRGEFIAQEVLPGPEYSVDVLCDLRGNPIVAVPRLRLTIADGVSIRAKIVKDQEIERICLSLAGTLGLAGPSCIQLRRDDRGELRVQEVNARLGGCSVASACAGVDMATLSVLLGLGIPFPTPEFREMTVVRHLCEVVLPAAEA